MDNAALQALLVGYTGTFKDTLNPLVDNSMMALVSPFQYTQEGEVVHIYGPAGAAEDWPEGTNRPETDVMKYSFEVRNSRKGTSIKVNLNKLRTNSYETMEDAVKALAGSAAITPVTAIANELIANKTCWDGKRLFADDHVLLDELGAEIAGTEFSNQIYDPSSNSPNHYLFVPGSILFGTHPQADFALNSTSLQSEEAFLKEIIRIGYVWQPCIKSAFPYLIFRSNKPLTEDSLEELKSLANAVRGPSGFPLNNKPTHLLVPQSLEKTARDILQRPVVNGSTNLNNGSLQLIVSPYLPDSFRADPSLS